MTAVYKDLLMMITNDRLLTLSELHSRVRLCEWGDITYKHIQTSAKNTDNIVRRMCVQCISHTSNPCILWAVSTAQNCHNTQVQCAEHCDQSINYSCMAMRYCDKTNNTGGNRDYYW